MKDASFFPLSFTENVDIQEIFFYFIKADYLLNLRTRIFYLLKCSKGSINSCKVSKKLYKFVFSDILIIKYVSTKNIIKIQI